MILELSLGALVLILLALAVIFLAARAKVYNTNEVKFDTRSLNVQAYRSRLTELESDLRAQRVNESEYTNLKTELDKALLQDTRTQDQTIRVSATGWVLPLVLSVFLIGLTAILYSYLGSGSTLVAMERQQQLVADLENATPQQRILRLEEERQRSDEKTLPTITYALAREYSSIGMYAESAGVYQDLLALTGEDSGLLAELAQVLYMAEGGQISDQVNAILQQVLSLDPTNSRALGLMGISAFEKQDYAKAINYWQLLLAQNPDAEGATALQAGIARARELMGDDDTADSSVASIQVTIDIAPELADRVTEDDIVFVFARASGGAAIPLAASRQPARFPLTVILDDSMAMIPSATLSSAETVDVVARISKSGGPQAQTGDLEGQLLAMKNEGKSDVNILINNVVE